MRFGQKKNTITCHVHNKGRSQRHFLSFSTNTILSSCIMFGVYSCSLFWMWELGPPMHFSELFGGPLEAISGFHAASLKFQVGPSNSGCARFCFYCCTTLLLHKGLGVFLPGSMPKKSIRFASFEQYKKILADKSTGKTSTSGVFFGKSHCKCLA